MYRTLLSDYLHFIYLRFSIKSFTMKRIDRVFLFAIVISLAWSCTSRQERMEKRMKLFITSFEAKAVPLYRDATITSWDANINGTAENWDKSEKASFSYAKIFTDRRDFEELRKIKESGDVKDPVLSRQLEILYNAYLGGQVDTALIAEQIKMETEINKKYTKYRALINGKELSDNQIEDILRNSVGGSELKAAWEGSKMIGPVVARDILDLVKKRNDIALKIGFSNYYEMTLKLSGQEPADITRIFNELDSLTRNNYIDLKGEIDIYFSKRYKIGINELKPWHYQNRYFQEAPEIYKIDFNKYFSNQDPVKLASKFYDGIGLNVDAILARSDLYEKPGKNQHAFCTDIDRSGDVRTLDNIRPDSYWMNTILHELGHGVYSYYNDTTLPFTLRDAAHPFTTEAIANMFGRLATDPGWMCKMGIIDEKESEKIAGESYKALRLRMLVFSRWNQVMYRFEKAMYENPGQDLNKLWWDLVEKYQMVKKPEGRNMPDWATKIHIALYPCYYHNYLLGEILASQLYYYIINNVTKNPSFAGDKAVGEFLRSKVFIPGARYHWNDMIEKATGEKLTAKYFAKQFVR
jgi:peptidyl-dipeptidase A